MRRLKAFINKGSFVVIVMDISEGSTLVIAKNQTPNVNEFLSHVLMNF